MFLNSCAWWERQRAVNRTDLSSNEGCTLSNAPFIVGQIEKSPNNEAVTITHLEGLAKTFTLNLKTCMRDSIRQDNPIQNTNFVIEYYSSEENRINGKLSKALASSDTQGCIQWQEKYNYKYTVKPVWIGLERTIKKETGAYAGAETIPMAVNPWLDDEDRKDGLPYILDTRCDYSRSHHVLDKSENYTQDGLKYLSETKREEQPILWAPTVSVQIHEVNPNAKKDRKEQDIRKLLSRYQNPCRYSGKLDCYQRQLKMNLYIPLELRSFNMSGLKEDKLLGGAYDIETELVISPKEDGNNYRLHENVCYHKKTTLNQTNNFFSFTCHLNFSYSNQNAFPKLVVRIQPSSPDLPFKKFEGVYSIKLNFQDERKDFNIDTVYDEDYREILGTSKKLSIVDNMNIRSVYSLLNRSGETESAESREDKLQIVKGPVKGLSFYPLHLDGVGDYKLSHIISGVECSDRENVVERTVTFVGQLCLTDVLSSQNLNNTPFRVFLEKPREGTIKEIYFSSKGGKKQLFKTDGRSCISVPVNIKHKLYNRQKYFQVDMHVLSEDLNLYGKVRLALSPWQRAFQAFQDAQNLNEDVIRFDTKDISKPKLIINQFRSISLFPSYGLDKLLNIHLFHRIYLLFQPFIRRPDNLALGLYHRSRELLRDGHYLVRVLVLRNPQETGDTGAWSRIQTTDEMIESRENKFTDGTISLKGAQYITHTDSIVKAKANFINFYMPLYLSTKQFFYIASRNFIVIEIHPADPSGFSYEEDCTVDTQKTVWRPFWDHELENTPYVGAYNIQHWVNWNLLQPVKDLKTDEIIEKSEIGREYKHFDFSADSERKNPGQTALNGEENSPGQTEPESLGCVNEILEGSKAQDVEKTLSRYKDGEVINSFDPSDKEVKQCAEDSMLSSAGLESYKRQVEKYFPSNVLEDFSKENSLKLVNLSDESANSFVQDIQDSFKKYINRRVSTGLSPSAQDFEDMLYLLNHLPKEDKGLIEFRIERMCTKDIQCASHVIKAYFTLINQDSDKEHSSIQFIISLINDNKLFPDSDRILFNTSLGECENVGSCLNNIQAYILNILDSYMDHLSFYEQNLFLESLMLFFSRDQKQQLFKQIEGKCFPWNRSFFKSSEDYKKCYYQTFHSFYSQMGFSQLSSFQNQTNQLRVSLLKEAFLQQLNVSDIKESSFLKSFMNKLTEDSLVHLIDTGIKSDNKYDSSVLSFTKPLCFFWFDHYLRDYLGQDQMIGAYTNHLRQFDYHQILDNSYSNDEEYNQVVSFYPNIVKYLANQDNEKSSACYDRYAECVLADHCQDRSINQSKNNFCSRLSIQDQTCFNVLKSACQKDPSLSLCGSECLFNPNSPHCGKQNFCNQEVRDFCLTNPDQDICAKYKSRCFANYLPCLKRETSVFDGNQALNYDGEDVSFGPLRACLNDPYDFFQFENKMVVHELSKQNNKYLGGFLETLNVAANFSIGSYMNWTAQRGRSLSAGGDFSGGSPRTWVLSMTGKLGLSQSMSSNESNSDRRAIDNRTGESVYFNVGNAKFQIGVKKFQNCLVVKPRPNSFMKAPRAGEMKPYKGKIWSQSASALKKIIVSRPGLILCNPIEDRGDKDPKYITENYYYFSQMMNSDNSQFLNLHDLANRPFMLILRGRKEFVKMYHILKMTIEGDNGVIEENGGSNRPPENMFIEYPFPVEEAVGLNLTIREFNETGFSPGIYHYPYDSDESLDVWFANKKHENSFFMEELSEHNLFDIPTHT
ncbi:MAG: hypothetical protein OXJ52_08175, partial [Oligoflexia bacterium]|nr:hypothetical protein [Oligoflexia bacterium]